MKLPTMESSLKAGMIYTGLKTIINSVGLEHNQILSSLIKYFSLCSAVFELMEEEFNFLKPYVYDYGTELIAKSLDYFKNYASHYSYNKKIISLCSKNTDNITQDHQKKIWHTICTEYDINSNHTKEHLFATSHDTFKAMCIILGDQELCSEILL